MENKFTYPNKKEMIRWELAFGTLMETGEKFYSNRTDAESFQKELSEVGIITKIRAAKFGRRYTVVLV